MLWPLAAVARQEKTKRALARAASDSDGDDLPDACDDDADGDERDDQPSDVDREDGRPGHADGVQAERVVDREQLRAEQAPGEDEQDDEDTDGDGRSREGGSADHGS